MNGDLEEPHQNGDDLRKVAILVLGAVLIVSIISLTITVAISGRGSEASVKFITIGTVALAIVAAGPIVVLRPRHRRYRDNYRDSEGQNGTVTDRD